MVWVWGDGNAWILDIRLAEGAARPCDWESLRNSLSNNIPCNTSLTVSGAPLAVVVFRDPYRYKLHKETFIATEGISTGSFIYCGKKAALSVGNVLPISACPEGTIVSNVEEKVGDRGTLSKTSGNYATVIGHGEDGKTRIRLPSGTKKVISSRCRATVGLVAGGGRVDKPFLKAGRKFHASEWSLLCFFLKY